MKLTGIIIIILSLVALYFIFFEGYYPSYLPFITLIVGVILFIVGFIKRDEENKRKKQRLN